MMIAQILEYSLSKQDIEVESPNEIPFNIHLVENIDYFLCFLLFESPNFLGVVETTPKGVEEIRIIEKSRIISIDIVYDTSDLFKKPSNKLNKMYV